MNRMLALSTLIAMSVGIAHAQPINGLEGFTSETLRINKGGESALATGISLPVGTSVMTAARATFRLDMAVHPGTMRLEDVQLELAGQRVLAADAATYYPQLRVLTASTISVISLDGSKNETPFYQCRGEQLLRDGEPVPYGRDCIDSPTGGSMNVSCTPSGHIKVEQRVESCPIDP